jgi:hypothetical protein
VYHKQRIDQQQHPQDRCLHDKQPYFAFISRVPSFLTLACPAVLACSTEGWACEALIFFAGTKGIRNMRTCDVSTPASQQYRFVPVAKVRLCGWGVLFSLAFMTIVSDSHY